MASITGLNTNGLTFGGLATGIDTDTLIAGLTKLNQQRIDTLKTRQADVVTQQTTFAALQGKLFDLQAKTAGLARAAGGAFDGRTATTNDAAAVTAAAGTAAVPGTYALTVTNLAQAHQVSLDGFADPNAQLKTGTIDLTVGAGSKTTVTVDARNNTLQGLADSINAAGGDVRATVLNTGAGATPYRLLLTSAKTGAANTIAVASNLSGGTGADLAGAPTLVQAAANAKVTIGSGTVVESPTNQLNSLIPGVTLNLLKSGAGPVTVTVANDTTTAAKAVQDFVTSYNAVQDFVREQSAYDAATQQAGVLLGNRDAAQLADDLSAALGSAVPGLTGAVNRLGAAGLSFDAQGKLNLDSAKLNQALGGGGGSTPADVKRLFGMAGAGGAGVTFLAASPKTVPSGATSYQVSVTTAATRAVVAADGALVTAADDPARPGVQVITVNPPNNYLSIKLNTLAAIGVTITPRKYTPDELAAEIQQQINASQAAGGGPQVAVAVDGANKLSVTNLQYGAASRVEVAANATATALGFTGVRAAAGTDVAGKYVVNGVEELATGAGQVLTGRAGNTHTDGLVVRATAGAPGTADVTVTQGLAAKLNQVLTKYLDPVNGRLKGVNDTYQQAIDGFNASITKQNDLMEAKKEQLTQQFVAMETAVNNLKGLQSQLAAMIPTSFSK